MIDTHTSRVDRSKAWQFVAGAHPRYGSWRVGGSQSQSLMRYLSSKFEKIEILTSTRPPRARRARLGGCGGRAPQAPHGLGRPQGEQKLRHGLRMSKPNGTNRLTMAPAVDQWQAANH